MQNCNPSNMKAHGRKTALHSLISSMQRLIADGHAPDTELSNSQVEQAMDPTEGETQAMDQAAPDDAMGNEPHGKSQGSALRDEVKNFFKRGSKPHRGKSSLSVAVLGKEKKSMPPAKKKGLYA